MSEKSIKTVETPTEGSFTKEQFLASAKYSYKDKDVLSALLEPGELYTASEAQQVIDDFMNKEVK
ncbi:hypothetical protein M2444_003560 [Paenibacillus sp. PastF-3]|uniref:hypothetical protein n=1 Tax=Paenibacillus sp. PastF-3 TaxID=2940626 RepID=UPI00247597DF|nr:hypothetical protein [Paenibacillus sp. PastF-3]MDH6371761.1 hypothetical protein [Paenibacillus sp. PastF-3]